MLVHYYWEGQINTAGANCSNDVNNRSISPSFPPPCLPPYFPPLLALPLQFSLSLLSLSLYPSLSQSLVLHFFLWDSVSSRLPREWQMTPSSTIIMSYHFTNSDRERELLFFNSTSRNLIKDYYYSDWDQVYISGPINANPGMGHAHWPGLSHMAKNGVSLTHTENWECLLP